MSYQLEQGVYFLAHPAFETTTGLGLQAASLEDQESVQGMSTAAAMLDFYSNRTEYSFLYNDKLGFALAATTTRTPVGESRRTPYIHMIFSGRHPHDAPEGYGFRAVFETGERDVSGLVDRAEVEPMPPWKLPDISRGQLAWLIHALWHLPSSRSGGNWPLLLSSDSLPQEWETPLQLAQIMCALAELIPPFFRRKLSGTTAALATKSADVFPIRLSASPEAYRLDALPVLEVNDPEDYFENFCLKMAQAYQEAPDTFRIIMDRVDQDGLTQLRQPTLERQMLAACCIVMGFDLPWCLEGAALAAMQKRVQTMLPNQREDRAFWEKQERLLNSVSPPDGLPELLKWLEQGHKSVEEKRRFLANNYKLSPERFIHESICLKNGPEELLAFLWVLPAAEEIMNCWEPEGMEKSSVFYPYLAEQLLYWNNIPLNPIGTNNAKSYFSARLEQGPDATLEELALLPQKDCRLLSADSIERRLTRTIEGAARLPDLQLLQTIPQDLLEKDPIKRLLTDLWHQEQPNDKDAFDQWKKSGMFLKIPKVISVLETYLSNLIDSLKTVQDIVHFAGQFLPCLTNNQFKSLKKALDRLTEQTETPEELELLIEVQRQISRFWSGGTSNTRLENKLKKVKLTERMNQTGLPGLLRMINDEPSVRMAYSEPAALWREQMRRCLEALGDGESLNLNPRDIDLINDAARYLGDADKALAHKFCQRFLHEYYPSLEDIASIRVRYVSLLGDDICDYAEYLAKQSSLEELYKYKQNDPLYQVQAPPEAWANLSWRERAEVCVRVNKSMDGQRIYKGLWALEDPFCKLLRRLHYPSYYRDAFDDEELKTLLGCLAELMTMLPEEKETLEWLLRLWQQDPAGPDNALCLELVRQVEQAMPQMEEQDIKCILKSWKAVFKQKEQRKLLKDAWTQQRKTRGQPLQGLPEHANAAEDLPKDEPVSKPGNRLLNGLDRLLAKCDGLIGSLFYFVGMIFRAPFLLLRKLLHILMR